MDDKSNWHLTQENGIGDMLRHPAFAGFSHLMLPWDKRRHDEGLRLKESGTLLPYHSHGDPETVVSALNYLIDDVNSGKTVFYDFYPISQRQKDRSLANTGLFFFRGKPDAPFAIIAPGGGAYLHFPKRGRPRMGQR
jgi:hypothetical protein